jgi:hypothetical protein
MYCYLLQDWTTIRANASLTSFTQGENDWFDASGFQDVVLWLDVKEVSFTIGNPSVAYQTAATKDESLFVTMATSPLFTFPGTAITAILKETAVPPLSRWLRWQLQCSSAANWDMTFRIFCALNAIGSNRPQPGSY